MVHVRDLRGKTLPGMIETDARESVREGMAIWDVGGKGIVCVTEEDMRDACDFCGSEDDLVIVGRAESKTKISSYDFGTVCRSCRASYKGMTKRKYDRLIESQMKMLAEFYVRYPGAQMALFRVGPGGSRDMIGYAPIWDIAEMVKNLHGKIVVSRANSAHLFEYSKPPTKREEKPDWFWDWFYAHHKGRCFFCGRSIPRKRASLDHLIPLTRLGQDEAQNLVLSCSWCNKDKGTMTAEEYLEYLERRRIIGRRLGIAVSIIGNCCEDYRRCVSHRSRDKEEPLSPIIPGVIIEEDRFSMSSFEAKYCSRCLNDRCSRMKGRCRDEEGRTEGMDPVDGVRKLSDMGGDVVGDGGRPEKPIEECVGSCHENQVPSMDGDSRVGKGRRRRRRGRRSRRI